MAEMNKLNHYSQSGHCYPDLIEKKEGKIVAELRSTIWKEDFQRINENFLTVLHEPLKNGIKILFCAKISYSPVYGLSLRILDIDPSWSLGELEKEKQQTLTRIRQEGVFNTNRSLKLPLLPKRIAIVSVETSKGYSDFRAVIDENKWGYSFFHMLFPALLQGENAIRSILAQMERIIRVKHHFDAVAIIRGGGGDVGLACYNNYELAKTIALFPLPVFTGIGHSTNETVVEMVAFRNAITPTELADFLIQQFHNFAVPVTTAQDFVINKVRQLLQDEKTRVLHTVRYFKSVTRFRLGQGRNEVQQEIIGLQRQSADFITKIKERDLRQQAGFFAKIFSFLQVQLKEITGIQRNIELLDPVNVLNRGYSITLVEDKVVKTVSHVGKGTVLRTILADGNIISTTNSVNKNKNP